MLSRACRPASVAGVSARYLSFTPANLRGPASVSGVSTRCLTLANPSRTGISLRGNAFVSASGVSTRCFSSTTPVNTPFYCFLPSRTGLSIRGPDTGTLAYALASGVITRCFSTSTPVHSPRYCVLPSHAGLSIRGPDTGTPASITASGVSISASGVRCLSTSTPAHTSRYCVLPSRAGLSLTGPDAASLLQGLVTNDLRHLDDRLDGGQDQHLSLGQQDPSLAAAPDGHLEADRHAIYAMFLNVQGRVLHDVLILRDPQDRDRLVVDCHRDAAQALAKHLKMYKLRKKVDIQLLEGATVVSVLHDDDDNNKDSLRGIEMAEGTLYSVDPRLAQLGHRFILSAGVSPETVFGSFESAPESEYDDRRYKLGVAEGPNEIVAGKSFPLECNVDYLHGVSFHKGCYIGQELTARVHHTGVVRKRVMPVRLMDDPCDVDLDASFVNDKGKNVGKLRGIRGRAALGLMRFAECAKSGWRVRLAGETEVEAEVQQPTWWPKEAPRKSSSSSAVAEEN